MKTNKALMKRIKVTRQGKILSRQGGQNHFRAKSRRRAQLSSNRLTPLTLSNKTRNQLINNHA
jgi:ribosomal protein L35